MTTVWDWLWARRSSRVRSRVRDNVEFSSWPRLQDGHNALFEELNHQFPFTVLKKFCVSFSITSDNSLS